MNELMMQPEKSNVEDFMPDIFNNMYKNIMDGESVELNEVGRQSILVWIYENLLDENAVWEDSYNGFDSLGKTMRQVNNVAQDASVNTHNREHVNLTMANSMFLCWVDFIEANKDRHSSESALNELLKNSLQHAAAALLHDVGYLGSLPRSSADFGYFLHNATKNNFNNHPRVSSVHAKEVLSYMTEGKGVRMLSVLSPQFVNHLEARPEKLWESEDERVQWCDDICEAIADHGTAQILETEDGERRSLLSKNLILADKLHVERRLNISASIRREEAQQIIFPHHAKGKLNREPQKMDIFSASHTRVTEAVFATQLTMDLINKKVIWALEYEPDRVEELAKKHEVEMGFTYDKRSFLSDFQRAYGGFNEKLKKIWGDREVEILPVEYRVEKGRDS